MSVFLTPEREPFYGGAYYPPAPRYDMPSFDQVLLAIRDTWKNKREELLTGAERVAAAIEAQGALGMVRGRMYDQVGGGFHRYSVDDRWLVPHFEK